MPAIAPIAVDLLLNPALDRAGDYGAEHAAILSQPALAEASAEIRGWPGYAQTPLHALPGLAQALGVASVHYKDEGGRFGLGSFKALGGAYAVGRLLCRLLGAQLGRPVTTRELLAGTHRALTQAVTVSCATDGNHGRSVAWGAQLFGCRCVIYIHATVTEGRRQAIEH